MVSHALLNQSICRLNPPPTEPWSEIRPQVPGRPSSWAQDTRRVGSPTEAARILETVRHAMEQNPEGARAAAVQLVALFTPLTEATFAAARGGLAPWQQRRTDRYVREHLEQQIRVEELAAQVSLSVSYFCRAFKVSLGDTPHAYIIRLRLIRAQELMLATRDPLSQIALACGFANQAHLSKLFRRMWDETPNAWRRRNIVDGQSEAGGRSCSAAYRTTSRFSSLDSSGGQRKGDRTEQRTRQESADAAYAIRTQCRRIIWDAKRNN